ncbi:hypothetical protein INT44_003690 [Umbelopsis vinacea]|uniref:Amino acid transporter n=1 Tax=Umbelopsis vinacea TaxID=44442 RepID=A0A8H7UI43_9FUNG|nr:hypothetical protein INT44_003690 [Umbelopsis vinacea]
MTDTEHKVADHKSDVESSAANSITENEAVSSSDDPIGHHIGLFGAVMLIVGRVVGSGIFASPGPLFAQVNSVGMALVLWTVTGMITAVGALAYAELATAFPASGGEYIYLLIMIFGQLPDYTRYNLFTLVFRYLLYLAYYHPGMAADKIPTPPNYAVKLVAVACIWAVAIFNMVSRSSGNYVQNVTAVAKFIGLFIICIVGIVWLAKGTYLFHFQNAFEGSSTTFWPYGTGIYLALFSYNGWNNATYSTGELRNPHRNIPLAVTISTISVTFIYVLTNVAYFATLPLDIIKTSSVTALNVGVNTMGPPGAYILTIFVMFSTFGTVNGNMFSASRVLLATAQNGILLPKFLAYVHPTRKTPIVALFVIAVITSALTAPGDFTFLSKMVTLVQWIFYCAAVVGLCYMRIFHSERLEKRAIKVPLPLLLLFVVVAAFLVIAPFIGAGNGYIQYVIVVVVVALAFPIWVVRVLFGINGGGGKDGVLAMEESQKHED